MREHKHAFGCGCDGHCDRREFLAATGAVLGGLTFASVKAEGSAVSASEDRKSATIRVAFLYPPSKTFADNQDGWWSWPGNQFDAEGRQREYTAVLRRFGA